MVSNSSFYINLIILWNIDRKLCICIVFEMWNVYDLIVIFFFRGWFEMLIDEDWGFSSEW